MARVTIRNLNQLRKKLNSKFKVVINKTLRDKGLRLKIGRIIEADIRKNFNKTVKSDATLAFRKYFEQYNETHPTYNRSKINITFTGELLNDLATNVLADTTNLGFIIGHSDKKHSFYKTAGKSKRRTVAVTSLKTRKTTNRAVKKTHKEISDYIIKDHGYEYLEVTDDAKDKIIKLVKDSIFDNIKRELT
jgi:hypothetical protein